MRFIFQFTLLLSLSQIVFGQTFPIRKIAERRDKFSSGSWTGADSFRWNYTAQQSVSEITALKYDNINNWKNQYRYTLAYNGNGKLTTQLLQNWNGTQWVNAQKYDFSYDANGNEVLSLYSTWNGTQWNNAGKIEKTGYNAANRYTNESYYLWLGGAWENLSKELFEYYPNDTQVKYAERYNWNSTFGTWDSVDRTYTTYNVQEIGSVTYMLPGSFGWKNSAKDNFTYNTNFLRTKYVKQVWDSISLSWKDNKQYEYFYTPFNKIEKVNEYINSAGSWADVSRLQYVYNSDSLLSENTKELFTGSWANDSRETHSYTNKLKTETKQYNAPSSSSWAERKKLSYQYYSFDSLSFMQIDTFDGASYAPLNRSFYYYNIYPLSSREIGQSELNLTVYPNPVGQTLFVALNSNEEQLLNFRICDVMGKTRMVVQQPIYTGENRVEFSMDTLPAGMYSLSTLSGNMSVSKRMFIKK